MVRCTGVIDLVIVVVEEGGGGIHEVFPWETKWVGCDKVKHEVISV